MSAYTKVSSRRRTDEVHFRIIYLSTLPAFVVVKLISRISTGLRSARPDDRGVRPSVLRDARASAQLCASWALMG